MTQGAVLEVAKQGLIVGLLITMPVLAVALFTGLIVSIFQAVTQIQEMTLTYLPKLIGAGIILVAMGGWMLSTLVTFMRSCFEIASRIGMS
jgi:flagellar biosynthetic protein FliQ